MQKNKIKLRSNQIIIILVMNLFFMGLSFSKDNNSPTETIYKDTFEPSSSKGIIPTQSLTDLEFKVNKSCPIDRDYLRRHMVGMAVFNLRDSKSIFKRDKNGRCTRTSEAHFLWQIDNNGRHKNVTSLNDREISKKSFKKDPVFERFFNGIYSTVWSGAQHDGTCNASVFLKYCTPEDQNHENSGSKEAE